MLGLSDTHSCIFLISHLNKAGWKEGLTKTKMCVESACVGAYLSDGRSSGSSTICNAHTYTYTES